MANLPAELKALPLEHIVGSPLDAAIKAQAMAARTTVEFIREVGLKTDPNTQELVAHNVEFKFDRTLEEIQAPLVAGGALVKNFRIVPSKLSVPLLAIVPIPFIRVTEMTIDFEYKVRDIETSESQTEVGVQAKVTAKYWFVKAEVSGSYSNKNANKRETDRSTTLRITVNAAQDQMPEGLGRVLDMMHDQLQVVPLSSGSLLPQPTARITSIAPISIPLATAVAAAQTLDIEGVGLTGATAAATVGDSTVTITYAADGTSPDTKGKITMTVTNATTKGEKTLALQTPKGQATVKITLT